MAGGVSGIGNIAVLAEAVLQVVIVQPDKVMINYRLPRGSSCRNITQELEGLRMKRDSSSHVTVTQLTCVHTVKHLPYPSEAPSGKIGIPVELPGVLPVSA